MNHSKNHWGVELNGADIDTKVWQEALTPPFDPFVEEIKDVRGDYLALRSTAFDGVSGSKDVYEVAKQLFTTLNVVMSKNCDTDPIANGAVIEFVRNGQPRKHHYMEAETGYFRLRGQIANFTETDSLPVPSRAQLWMRATMLNSEIGSALRYLEGKPGWDELYKAYEAVKKMPNGNISNSEISRFTRTANVEGRHHPSEKFKPHKRPMELWEARSLITQWISAAIKDILAKNSTNIDPKSLSSSAPFDDAPHNT